ncbi:MAG: hypothetical protein M3387_07075, partial [Actinomycetota bacterium]|nr:hypothetical protein [Actinomycetota bacterium]
MPPGTEDERRPSGSGETVGESAGLPMVIVTSVIRSTYQGQSHGGVYLVDLSSGSMRKVIDWDQDSISWEGRGGDRGLRGIAFWRSEVYLAASDEVFVYDRDLRLQRSFRNAYLKHCHEIHVDGDRLWLASAGFDSVLGYDLSARRFDVGYCVRYGTAARAVAKATRRRVRPGPSFRRFHPEGRDGPEAGDTSHINSVTCRHGRVHLSGTQLPHVLRIDDDRLSVYARIPLGTHNARPFGDGVIMNNTVGDTVAVGDRDGYLRLEIPVPRYDEARLRNTDLAGGDARQAFGRGLSVHAGRYLISGS